jgi:hypothetical protein
MTDFQDELAQLLEPHTPEIRALVEELRGVICSLGPDLQEEVKLGWKNIGYKGKGLTVSLMPYTSYVSLHFAKGVQLSDPQGVLEGGGKELRHLKVRKLEDVHPHILTPLMHEAIELDQAS